MARRWWEIWRSPWLFRAPADTPKPVTDGSEKGVSGTDAWSGYVDPDEYNAELVGQTGLLKYDEMRRSMAATRATLEIVKLPLRSATWTVTPPDKGDTQDQAVADFCYDKLLGQGAMQDSWTAMLRHAMLAYDFGTSGFEKVFTIGETGEYQFKRLAPRLPKTFIKFFVNPDGTLSKVVQRAYKNNRLQDLPMEGDYFVPVVHDREGDNYWGISMLRPAFIHWFYVSQLYRIDGVKHHRWGVGTPIGEVTEKDAGLSANDYAAVRKTLQNFNAQHDAHAIAPFGLRYRIMTPEGAGGASGLLESVEHHIQMISRTILAGFLANAAEGMNTNRTKTLADLFLDALRAKERDIAEPFQTYAIKPLCDLNFDMTNRPYPTLGTTDLSKVDVQEMAETANTLVGARILTPDDEIEGVFRSLLKYPPLPKAMRRGNQRPEPVNPQDDPNDPEDDDPKDSGDESGGASDRSLRLRMSRQANRLELLVLSLAEIPRRLDGEVATLLERLTSIRRRQLEWAAKKLARLDARPTQPFTDLRPDEIDLPYQTEMVRAIREMQDAIIQFGADQVRLELRRQGAPITLAQQATPGAQKRTVRSQAVTTAKVTVQKLSDAWLGRILDEATRQRRIGVQEDALADAIRTNLADAADSGLKREVNARVNEAFGAGRSLAAHQESDRIDRVVQSAILDRNTCGPCEDVDGEEMEFGSERQRALEPPYVECEGRDQCRCVQLFIFAGAR